MAELFVHRIQCAAITNGCMSVLLWEDHLAYPNVRQLELNGWWLDHGRWVCANHEHVRSDDPQPR